MGKDAFAHINCQSVFGDSAPEFDTEEEKKQACLQEIQEVLNKYEMSLTVTNELLVEPK